MDVQLLQALLQSIPPRQSAKRLDGSMPGGMAGTEFTSGRVLTPAGVPARMGGAASSGSGSRAGCEDDGTAATEGRIRLVVAGQELRPAVMHVLSSPAAEAAPAHADATSADGCSVSSPSPSPRNGSVVVAEGGAAFVRALMRRPLPGLQCIDYVSRAGVETGGL